MKRLHRSLALGAMFVGCAGFGLVACGDDDDSDNAETGTETLANGPGQFTTDFATSADFFTFKSGMVEGKSPHGKVQIWYSSNIKSLLDASQSGFTVPVGTVSVKQFENDNGRGLAVMVKREVGYDSENNDWHYEMRDEAGMVMTGEDGNPVQGRVAMCIGCHASASSTDYLAGINVR